MWALLMLPRVDQLKAQLDGAKWNLDKTTVRAPADGYVTNVALRAHLTDEQGPAEHCKHLRVILDARLPAHTI
jgi:hypothetical protein